MFLVFCCVFPQTGEYTGKCNGNVRGPKPQHSKNTHILEVFHHFQGHQAPSKSACFLNVLCFLVVFSHTLVNKTSTFKKHTYSQGFPPFPGPPSPIQKCMFFECFFLIGQTCFDIPVRVMHQSFLETVAWSVELRILSTQEYVYDIYTYSFIHPHFRYLKWMYSSI